jgi:hypothetical protein
VIPSQFICQITAIYRISTALFLSALREPTVDVIHFKTPQKSALQTMSSQDPTVTIPVAVGQPIDPNKLKI